jgi:hypothetical protein
MGIRFYKFHLTVRMTCITDLVHPVPENALEIRSMRVMADTAFLCAECGMSDLRRQFVPVFGMAGKT